MSSEIVVQNAGIGSDYYYQIRNTAQQVRNATQFVAFATGQANWTFYAQAQAAPNAAGDYVADLPAGLPAGFYFVKVLRCVTGATPLPNDEIVKTEEFWWTGTQRADRLGTVQVDMTQTVPIADLTAKTTQNLGDCLSAARAQAAGAASKNGLTNVLKGPDGSIVRTFTVDNATTPTSRT